MALVQLSERQISMVYIYYYDTHLPIVYVEAIVVVVVVEVTFVVYDRD